MYIGSRFGDRLIVWAHAGFTWHSASAPNEDRLAADGCRRSLGIPVAMRQDPQARNPSVAGALRLPATEETPESQGIFGRRRFAKAGRWESLGKRQDSKGGRSRSASVVGDGQAWVSGPQRYRAARRLALLPHPSPPTETTAGNVGGGARPPKREAVHSGCAADGGNRADRRGNGPPGHALTPVRSPVRKVARGFCCHRNCANDRSGLMGDVRRAHVSVRPAPRTGASGAMRWTRRRTGRFRPAARRPRCRSACAPVAAEFFRPGA